ncbi:MAG: hypothetical protein U1F83_08080 [Verrucomicrobiota bacterium]
MVATYHAGSDTNPILSIFFVSGKFGGTAGTIPFQSFGFVALFILFLMAATSHDFWLANLSALRLEGAAHAGCMWRQSAFVGNVTFECVLQGEGSPVYVGATALGLVAVLGLHLSAGRKERDVDATNTTEATGEFVDARGRHSRDPARGSCVFPESAWQFSDTRGRFPLSQMSASTKTVLWAKVKSSSAVTRSLARLSVSAGHRKPSPPPFKRGESADVQRACEEWSRVCASDTESSGTKAEPALIEK